MSNYMKNLLKVLAKITAGCAALVMLDVSVRADAPRGHFTDLGDGTVRDNATGLVWQRDFSRTSQSQAASVTYCTGLTTAGGGWRLPSILELRSIVDERRSRPAIDPSVFPGTPSEAFWSASMEAGSPSSGWAVWFVAGDPGGFDVADMSRARCVR